MEPESLYGGLLALCEALRFRGAAAAEDARAAVVAALRADKGDPLPLDPEDGSWSPVVAGRYEVGCFRDAEPERQADETLHEVDLSPFRLCRYAVSLEEYRRFDRTHEARAPYDPDLPALQVSWYEAVAYAAWVGAALPTEAQCEVAARGGAHDYRKTAYYNGNGKPALKQVGQYLGNQDRLGATPLPARQPIQGAPDHPLGLVHIHGNILEWCLDWYAPYPETPTHNPAGPPAPPDPAAARRVLRGGSWDDSVRGARSACRSWSLPAGRDGTVGFRLVLPQPALAVDP